MRTLFFAALLCVSCGVVQPMAQEDAGPTYRPESRPLPEDNCAAFRAKLFDVAVDTDLYCYEKSGSYQDCVSPIRSLAEAWNSLQMCDADSIPFP
jgi:hypothetical protein